MAFLSDPQTFMAEMERRRRSGTSSDSDTRSTIEALKRKLDKVTSMETELLTSKLRGLVSQEAVERSAALLRAERSHYQDELERQEAALATLYQSRAALESLVDLRNRMIDRLESATLEDRRWVLQTLNARIQISKVGLEVSLGVPGHLIPDNSVSPTPEYWT
jgi:predicted nuclease with TOPRIM domain